MILSLAAGPDNQVSLVQGLHHLLSLVETDVVEVGVGDHALYIRYRKRKQWASVSKYVHSQDKEVLNQTLINSSN